MNESYLLTGGNMGNRLDFLRQARLAISEKCGEIEQLSSVYETAAWGMRDQPAFLNQVLRIETSLGPGQLLEAILGIEQALGRKRDQKYGPRSIDIDILFFNEDLIDKPGLKLPHPHIQDRRFVLVPLSEIAAGKIHPLYGKTISQLLTECADPLPVNKFS